MNKALKKAIKWFNVAPYEVKILENIEAEAKRELIKDLTCTFDMSHACGCPEWCDCWKNFEKKHLEGKSE